MTSKQRSTRKRVFYRITTMLAVILGFTGITILPASAHHPEIQANADCQGVVHYKSTAWQTSDPAARTNPDIRIQAQVNGGSWKQVGSGAFKSPGFSFSGTWDAGDPYPGSVKLRAYAAARWANGADGGSYSETVTVGAPSGCEVKKPAASISHDCNGYDVTLDNSRSNVAVDFKVTVNGSTGTVTVPKGATRHSTGPVTEDQAYTISVSVDGSTLKSDSFTVDCVKKQPKASITYDCNGYTVNLDNSDSNVGLDFAVTVNGTTTSHHLAAGKTRTITGPVTEDASYAVTVKADGDTVASKTFTVDCVHKQPKATIDHDCATYTVKLDNTDSNVRLSYAITVNGVTTSYHVAAGATRTVTGPVTEDASYTIAVDSNGGTVRSDTFKVDCKKPVAAITHDCTTYDVTLDNAGSTLPVDFTVTVDGTDKVITVPAGQTRHETGPVTEDTGYTITATAEGAQLATDTFTVNCVADLHPTAKVTVDCFGFKVVLDNAASSAPATYVVTTPGGTLENVTVTAGASATRTYPVVEDATSRMTVKSSGMADVTASYAARCTIIDPPLAPPSVSPPVIPPNHGGSTHPSASQGAAAAVAPTSGVLPNTGSSISMLLLLLALSLVAGGSLVAAGSRARAKD